MSPKSRLLAVLSLVLWATLAVRAGAWEIRRGAEEKRPPVEKGIVTIDVSDKSSAFPRYLNEFGVKTIRLRFHASGSGKRRLSIVWTGGSQGPDRFGVSVDGAEVGLGQKVDTAARPYAWYRDDFTVTLKPAREHVLEIRSLPEFESAIDIAAIRLDAPNAPDYQPLCWRSIGSLSRYEQALGERGIMIESAHITIFAPETHAAEAGELSRFLEKAYAQMRDIYGIDPVFRFSVEHYRPGNKLGWGGIDGMGAIGYQVEALERFGKLGTTDFQGFSGYTEEMCHGFKSYYRCSGTYEALGVAVQEDVTRRLAPASVVDPFWLPEHKSWEETHRAYLAAGRANPDPERYPNGVLYTRILNDIFLKLRTEYGPRLWPDFFAQIRKMNYPLDRAEKTERMKVYADIFSSLLKRDMRAEFASQGIDLNANPPWGWQTYENEKP